MSLYNMMNGVNPATFLVLPMLGKHPDDYPRFRDCFVGALQNSEKLGEFGIPVKTTTDDRVISVYLRVGGSNRHEYAKQIESLRQLPGYMRDYDDSFDSTYCTFIFAVPDEWSEDFDLIINNSNGVSDGYVSRMCEVYPKLADKFKQIFGKN